MRGRTYHAEEELKQSCRSMRAKAVYLRNSKSFFKMEIHNRSGYILAYRNRKVGLDQITEGFESLGLKSRMFFIITRGFEGI